MIIRLNYHKTIFKRLSGDYLFKILGKKLLNKIEDLFI